jgi:hypothetical protein
MLGPTASVLNSEPVGYARGRHPGLGHPSLYRMRGDGLDGCVTPEHPSRAGPAGLVLGEPAALARSLSRKPEASVCGRCGRSRRGRTWSGTTRPWSARLRADPWVIAMPSTFGMRKSTRPPRGSHVYQVRHEGCRPDSERLTVCATTSACCGRSGAGPPRPAHAPSPPPGLQLESRQQSR